MTEHVKGSTKPLDGKAEYLLWKIRLEAACGFKGLKEVLVEDINTTSADEAGF